MACRPDGQPQLINCQSSVTCLMIVGCCHICHLTRHVTVKNTAALIVLMAFCRPSAVVTVTVIQQNGSDLVGIPIMSTAHKAHTGILSCPVSVTLDQ